jgi:hypothetical protein
VNADAKHKLIRRYDVSDAAVHDSQKLDALLTKGSTSDAVFGDSALKQLNLIHRPRPRRRLRRRTSSAAFMSATRGHSFSKADAEANCKKGRLRARVEHVFGVQQISPGLAGSCERSSRQSTGEDRIAEPRLQPPSPRGTRTDGRRMNVQPSEPSPWLLTGPIRAASISDYLKKCSPIPALSQSRRDCSRRP